MILRALLLLLLGCACLSACGRLGYQSVTSDAGDAAQGAIDASVDAPDDAGPDASHPAPDATTRDSDIPSTDGATDAPRNDADLDAGPRLDAADDAASDAGLDANVGLDAMTDATDDAGDAGQDAGGPFDAVPCTVDVVWESDFADDPTTLDRDNNDIPDWIVRGGGTFPAGEIANGTWVASGPVPLDSNPPRNIVTTAYVDVRLRSLQVPAPVATDFEGALFWVNVDYTSTDFAPLYVSVSRTAVDQQEVRFYGKSTNTVGTVLLGPVTTGPDLIHVQMEIDPATSTLRAWIDGTLVGSAMFPRVSDLLNNDQFATAFAASAPVEYDAARVAVCVP